MENKVFSEGKMKKIAILIVALTFFPFCISKQNRVEKTMEDGVEVVINHLEPYKIKGQPANLILEKEFSIDTEKDDIVKTGLGQLHTFDLDSEGNIYLMDAKPQQNIIFKFDRNGGFVSSLIRKGQGPGESQFPFYFQISSLDEFVLMDHGKEKLLILGKDGSPKREMPIKPLSYRFKPLTNGKFLFLELQFEPPSIDITLLSLCSPDLKEEKEIEKMKTPNAFTGKQAKATPYMFVWNHSDRNIYAASEERGYEISVFDLEGNLKKKIRKEFKPVEVSEEFKKYVSDAAPENVKKNLYFPRQMSPLQYLFADDEDNLFAMTYEAGKMANEYIYDIFNPDGVFIGRMSLDNYSDFRPLEAKAEKKRLYSMREKESGYKELVVYRMKWR
jgi:hypothetical protein